MSVFKLDNLRLINKGALLCSVDIQTPAGWVVYGAMLLESHGRRWINFPGIPWVKGDGSKSYKPVLGFASKEIKEKFEQQVLPLIEQALADQQGKPDDRGWR